MVLNSFDSYILWRNADPYAVAIVPNVVGVRKYIFVAAGRNGQVIVVSLVKDKTYHAA